MIHLILNDLCHPAGEDFCARLHFHGLILDLDGFIAFARSRTAEMRQTAFRSIVRAVLLDNIVIEHHGVCRCSPALVEKGDYALVHANHIRRHVDTDFFVYHQLIKQVLCDRLRRTVFRMKLPPCKIKRASVSINKIPCFFKHAYHSNDLINLSGILP